MTIPNATKTEAAATNSDRSTPASKVANRSRAAATVAVSSQNNTNNRRRRSVPLPQLQSRQAQVHPTRTDQNVAAAAIRPRSRSNNPEALPDHHSQVLISNQHQNVHRIGSGQAAADGFSLTATGAVAAAAAAAAGPPSPPRCSTGRVAWPSPAKFQPEPSRIIKISSDPTLSGNGRRLLREHFGNANASSWDFEEEDHEARAEDERMYDLATWRMYHRIMEARQRRQAETAMLESHPDAAAAPTAQKVERMVLNVKEQAEATYQQRLSIMENAIAITGTSLSSTTVDDDEEAGHHYVTVPTDDDGPPSPLSSVARSPRGLMRMLDRARKISIGAESDTQGLFTMDL
mmetsp:Transcript_2163/g.6286  ORF Transcript_2163/g.6286 Transcript_2163/m.6286 type:complete len:347 (+) Transcript_2163:196-1236(+)